MDFYAYLLSGMGFDVHKTSYFLVCNAKRDEEQFNKKMKFDEYIIPYDWKIDWLEKKLDEMIILMNQSKIPKPNLNGQFQIENASTAIATLRILENFKE